MSIPPCFPSIINILTAFSQEVRLEKARSSKFRIIRAPGTGAATKPPDIPRHTRYRDYLCSSCSTVWAVETSNDTLTHPLSHTYKESGKNLYLIAFWLYLLCIGTKQSVAMLLEFIMPLWVEAFMCLWSLGLSEVLIPFWSLDIFSYPEITPALSLTHGFYKRGAQIRIALLLGMVMMIYRKFTKVY